MFRKFLFIITLCFLAHTSNADGVFPECLHEDYPGIRLTSCDLKSHILVSFCLQNDTEFSDPVLRTLVTLVDEPKSQPFSYEALPYFLNDEDYFFEELKPKNNMVKLKTPPGFLASRIMHLSVIKNKSFMTYSFFDTKDDKVYQPLNVSITKTHVHSANKYSYTMDTRPCRSKK